MVAVIASWLLIPIVDVSRGSDCCDDSGYVILWVVLPGITGALLLVFSPAIAFAAMAAGPRRPFAVGVVAIGVWGAHSAIWLAGDDIGDAFPFVYLGAGAAAAAGCALLAFARRAPQRRSVGRQRSQRESDPTTGDEFYLD